MYNMRITILKGTRKQHSAWIGGTAMSAMVYINTGKEKSSTQERVPISTRHCGGGSFFAIAKAMQVCYSVSIETAGSVCRIL